MNIELDQPQLSAIIRLVEREHRMWTTIAKDAEAHPDGRHPGAVADAAYRRDATQALADHLKGYQP